MSGQPLLCAECFGHGEVFPWQLGGPTKYLCDKCQGSGLAAIHDRRAAR